MDENIVSGLKRLPSGTVKLIGSAQVITSVSSVVKELMENAVDAGASNIEVKLENHGLDRLEVKDNGCGIKKEDVPFMCKRSYTSKITDFSDLEKLSSYGFRGEALSSLCSVAKVSITTKTDLDDVAHTYVFNNSGDIVASSISHLNKGTCVVAEDLFKNLPVRKQFLTSGKRRGEELKKVETLVKCLALINHGVRVVLSHNKFTIWQKSAVCSIMRSFVQVLPPTVIKLLHEIHFQEDKTQITLMIPNRECNVSNTCYKNPMESIYLFINSRPIRDKLIEKAIHEEVCQFFGTLIPVNKYPTCLASIVLPPDCLDVNLEPNKTKVIIKDMDVLIQLIKKLIVEYYVGEMELPKPSQEIKIASKRKSDDLIEVVPKMAKIFTSDEEESLLKMEEDTPNETKNPNVQNEHISLTKSPEKTSNDLTETNEILNFTFEDSSQVSNTSAKVEQEIEDLVRTIFRKEEVLNESNGDISQIEEPNDLNEDKTQDNHLENEPKTEKPPECHVANLADWSRGNVQFNGRTVEGTTVVVRPAERSCMNDTLNSTRSSQLSDRSVSSQMGQKEMAAFTKFARDCRSKIIKERPGITFTSVASELATRWKDLQESEKEAYKELAQAEKEKNKIKKSFSLPTSSTIFKKKEDKPPKKVYPKLSVWDISLDIIKKSIHERAERLKSKPLELVGKLNDDMLILKESEAITLFSSKRLNEAMKYYNNLCYMSVPTKVLENSIPIKKDEIGEVLWEVLISLETSYDEKTATNIISIENIAKNGLRIEKFEGESDMCFCITDVPANIDFFGIDDLIEILEEIKDRKGLCKLINSRPLKVINYIRSETIKSLSENCPQVNDSYVTDVYKFWREKIKPESCNCPHFFPVSKCLHDESRS